MVKKDARQPFPFASRTRLYHTEKLTTVPPDTWVELYDDDIIQMGSSHTFKYRVMIPLSPILIPEIVPASKPHLLKLAFPGSCIARIIGQQGQVINHIKETFKCTIFSANQGVYVSGLQSSQARLFKIGAESFTRLIESVDEVLRVSQITDDPVSLHIILPDSPVGKLQGSQGHGLEQLGARSGVQVNLLPRHLLHCRGRQEGLLNVVKYVVGVLGPIPSGYDPDDGSEEGVQVPARNQNDHANTLLQSTHARGSQAPHVITRLKQQFPGMSWEKGRRHAQNVGKKLHHKEGRKHCATFGVSKRVGEGGGERGGGRGGAGGGSENGELQGG